MTRLTQALAITLLAVFSISATAAETGRMVEAFSCNYQDGKGAADLQSAISHFNAEVDKLGQADLSAYRAAVLTPLRANIDNDFLWIGGAESLNSMGRSLDATLDNPGMQSTTERFDEVADCDAGLFFSTEMYVGLPQPGPDDDQAIIEMFGCTLKDGKSISDAAAAEQHWSGIAKKAKAKTSAYRWTPFLANTPFDLIYVGVHDNATSFASFNSGMLTSPDGQASGEKFDAVMECEGGLFVAQSARRPGN